MCGVVGIEEFDVIGLTETWLEEEAWKKIKNRLSDNFEWYSISASRDNKKGRVKGGNYYGNTISREIEEEIKSKGDKQGHDGNKFCIQ